MYSLQVVVNSDGWMIQCGESAQGWHIADMHCPDSLEDTTEGTKELLPSATLLWTDGQDIS